MLLGKHWPPEPRDLIANDVELWFDLRNRILDLNTSPKRAMHAQIPVDTGFIYLGEPIAEAIPKQLIDRKGSHYGIHALWVNINDDQVVVYVTQVELWSWFRLVGRPAEEKHAERDRSGQGPQDALRNGKD